MPMGSLPSKQNKCYTARLSELTLRVFDMPVLPVLQYPDPRLRIKASQVTEFNDELKAIIKDLFETMYAEDGAGLAATQVDIHKRIFVMDFSDGRTQPYCIINPEIIEKSGTQFEYEACLSVSGVHERIERAQTVTIRYQDETGALHTLTAQDLMAKCIQHEGDHLDGILFSDHLSRLKQERIRKKHQKYLKQIAS